MSTSAGFSGAIPVMRPRGSSRSVLGFVLSGPVLLWLLLWCSINSGPWNLRLERTDTWDLIHAGRAALPLVVLLLVAATALQHAHRIGWRVTGPARLWTVYGVVTLLAAAMSEDLYSAAYWSLAYLATIFTVAVCTRRGDPLGDLERLNRFNWAVASGMIVMLVFIARDALFVGEGYEMTGYGVVTRVGTVAGMAMSRSSGMARFSAIPGIAAFVLMWRAKGFLRKFLWAIPVCLAAGLIYLMQSRGAIVGFAFALAFVSMLLGRGGRILGILAVLLAVVALVAGMVPEEVIQHLLRGEKFSDLRTLTGRTRAWGVAWPYVTRSPLWGYGMQADRALIQEHVHNTYLYALLSGGFVGAGFFAAGLVWAWLLFRRALASPLAAVAARRTVLLQAGGILAFFTVRSIPEVCGAMFGVDLMAMLPILAYLTVFERVARRVPPRPVTRLGAAGGDMRAKCETASNKNS